MKRINIAGIVLLIGGIAIGIALTMISMHAVGIATPATHTAATSQHKLIAEQSPPGAADAQTPQPEAPAQTEQEQSVGQAAESTQAEAPQAPADWLKPQDVASQNGAAPSAVPASPHYQSSHTEYYIYPTGPVSVPADMPTSESGYVQAPYPNAIGENGLLQNPCVDPPSVRGRAYSH